LTIRVVFPHPPRETPSTFPAPGGPGNAFKHERKKDFKLGRLGCPVWVDEIKKPNLIYLTVPNSTENSNHATSRKPSSLFRSILSMMNFLKIESWDESERNSGKVWRKAMAGTSSEGAKSVRMVLNQ
jgi:hypothetical protein